MAHDGVLAGKEVRVEMRLRNNRLWNLIFPKWESVAEFCRELGLHNTIVGKLLNLKLYPISEKGGGYRVAYQKIAEYFRILPEDLFPLGIYELDQTEGSSEVGVEEISYHQCALLEAPDAIGEMEESIGREQLIERLFLLVTPRERRVLEMKCGYGEYEPHTFDEIGGAIGCGKARAQQIFDKAIRRLRRNRKAWRAFNAFASGSVSDALKLEDEIRSVQEYVDALECAIAESIKRKSTNDLECMLELWFGVNGNDSRALGEIAGLFGAGSEYRARCMIHEDLFHVACDHDVKSVLRRNDAECIMQSASSYSSLQNYKPRV